MGKKRRAMKFPHKFAGKFGTKFASVIKLGTKQEITKPEPEPIVEEVAIVVKPKPAPKVTKKAPTKRKTTKKRTTTKKSTTKRSKRSTVKKDK